MVQAHGVLHDDRVVIEDQSEASRLSERGSYGRRTGNVVSLDLYEATYLVEEGRLAVTGPDGGAVDHDRLVILGAARLERFETNYLVYRDHRARGFVVRQGKNGELDGWSRGSAPPKQRPGALVAARGEADPATPAGLQALVDEGLRDDRQVLLAIVDEESDVTYYELGPATISGHVDDPADALAPKARGVLLGDRALLVEDAGLAASGYGNTAGGQTFLSLAETHHLAQRGLVLEDVAGRPVNADAVRAAARATHAEADQALAAYTWLRERALVPKTGFKFGVQYRVYKGRPDEGHAPFLVHALGPDTAWTHQGLARFARLAHSVRKRPILWSNGAGVVLTWTRP